VPFRVESGDLQLFHARAVLKLAGVSVALPQDQMSISGVDGELPVVEEIVMGPEGAQMVGHGERGIYPQQRFSDQQPFLGNANFLSIAAVQVGEVGFGPAAANARVDRDVISLDQMEVTALDGKITGQCLVELRGKDTSVAFRGKVTGIRPGRGDRDRLDAHAALTMSPYRLKLDGRVEIVRIAKGHLLKLLDAWDPYHADVAANRVRLGLNLGYPKQVRLHFLHGFASMAIQLGGLAGAVRIDEISGIPIGPAMARFLAPVLEGP
jgi:translocation and assembly module TamB